MSLYKDRIVTILNTRFNPSLILPVINVYTGKYYNVNKRLDVDIILGGNNMIYETINNYTDTILSNLLNKDIKSDNGRYLFRLEDNIVYETRAFYNSVTPKEADDKHESGTAYLDCDTIRTVQGLPFTFDRAIGVGNEYTNVGYIKYETLPRILEQNQIQIYTSELSFTNIKHGLIINGLHADYQYEVLKELAFQAGDVPINSIIRVFPYRLAESFEFDNNDSIMTLPLSNNTVIGDKNADAEMFVIYSADDKEICRGLFPNGKIENDKTYTFNFEVNDEFILI